MSINFAGLRFKIEPNWKIALFYVLLMPVLLRFGFWQIERAEEKKQLEQEYHERMLARPISLHKALLLTDRAYVQVFLTGEFDNERTVLLDNKIYQGQVGYEVISPFELSEPVSMQSPGKADTIIDYVWINRGWISLGGSREQLPPVPPVLSRQRIVAGIDIPPGEAFVLAEEPYRGVWPEVVQAVDLERMSARYREDTGVESAPFMLRLVGGSPGLLQMIWHPINMSPAKHLGYALQWFSMALALTILYVYVTFKRIKDDDLK